MDYHRPTEDPVDPAETEDHRRTTVFNLDPVDHNLAGPDKDPADPADATEVIITTHSIPTVKV
jgi:hypothetical protein